MRNVSWAGVSVGDSSTGQAAADVNIELHLLMPLSSLLNPTADTPAEILGHGPVPAGIAGDLLRSSRGRVWWRRLFTAPAGGPIVGGDRFRRRFDGWLAQLISLRDRTCRHPSCDAPIRHLDHVHRRADGGPTTLANGRGVCERGNYVREMPGWTATVTDDGRHSRPHTVMITTPTGHTYTSSAPQPP
ncbi:MAG TPA: HNH endonuclease signature motif containing protein [Propionibacteriaceae bacterium]|nr:HNH endonuclease signature motif containing protein [Propionibacteriaceae bacterium]